MIIHRCEQLSDDWFALKTGLPSASKADKILTPTGKLSAQSAGYINELLAERAGYGDDAMEPTEWMLRGINLEPEARDLFEFETGLTVDQVGFVTNDDGTAGCSPDGLILDSDNVTAGFEVKCPKASTHIGYLLGRELPAYYRPQVHYSMAVTGLNHWWFMSYFPGLDPLIIEVERDDYTEKVAEAVTGFIERLAEAATELEIAA